MNNFKKLHNFNIYKTCKIFIEYKKNLDYFNNFESDIIKI